VGAGVSEESEQTGSLPASVSAGSPARPENATAISETPEEAHVEVHHKPKPVHGWREFVGEYAIIVLGVLTALAAEQSVEWLHWQTEVSAARKAITQEIQENNSRLFGRRIAVASCMDRQAKEVAEALDALEAGRKPEPFTSFHVVTGSLVSDSEWQSERAAQTLVHFPRDELALLSRYYGQMQVFSAWIEEELDTWKELSVLENPPQSIGASDILRMRIALRIAQGFIAPAFMLGDLIGGVGGWRRAAFGFPHTDGGTGCIDGCAVAARQRQHGQRQQNKRKGFHQGLLSHSPPPQKMLMVAG